MKNLALIAAATVLLGQTALAVEEPLRNLKELPIFVSTVRPSPVLASPLLTNSRLLPIRDLSELFI